MPAVEAGTETGKEAGTDPQDSQRDPMRTPHAHGSDASTNARLGTRSEGDAGLDSGSAVPTDPQERTRVPAKLLPGAKDAVDETRVVDVIIEGDAQVAGSVELESAYSSTPVEESTSRLFEVPVLDDAVGLLITSDAAGRPIYFAFVAPSESNISVGAASTAIALLMSHPVLAPLLARRDVNTLLSAVEGKSAIAMLASEIRQAAAAEGADWPDVIGVQGALGTALDAALDAAAEAMGAVPTADYRVGPRYELSGMTLSAHRDDDGFAVDEPADMGIMVTNSYKRFIDVRFGEPCGVAGDDKGPVGLYHDGYMDACTRDSEIGEPENVAHDCVVSVCEVEGDTHSTSVDAYGCGALGEWDDEAACATVLTAVTEVALPVASAFLGAPSNGACNWRDAVNVPGLTDSVQAVAEDSSLIGLAAEGDFVQMFGQVALGALKDTGVNLAVCYGPGLALRLARATAARVFQKTIPVIGQITLAKDLYDVAQVSLGAGKSLYACSVSRSHERWEVSSPSFKVRVFAYAGGADDSVVLPCTADDPEGCVLNLETEEPGPTTLQLVLECSADGEHFDCPSASFQLPGGENTTAYDPASGIETEFPEGGAKPASITVRSADGIELTTPLSILLGNCDADGDGDTDNYCNPTTSTCVDGQGCVPFNCDLDSDGEDDTYCEAGTVCVGGHGCATPNCDGVDQDAQPDLYCDPDAAACERGSGCLPYDCDYDGDGDMDSVCDCDIDRDGTYDTYCPFDDGECIEGIGCRPCSYLEPLVVGAWTVTSDNSTNSLVLREDGSGEYTTEDGSSYPMTWKVVPWNEPVTSPYSVNHWPLRPVGYEPGCVLYDTGFFHYSSRGLLRDNLTVPVNGFNKYRISGPYPPYSGQDLSSESPSQVWTKH